MKLHVHYLFDREHAVTPAKILTSGISPICTTLTMQLATSALDAVDHAVPKIDEKVMTLQLLILDACTAVHHVSGPSLDVGKTI